MSDFLDTATDATPASLKPTPAGLMARAGQEDAQARKLEAEATEGRKKLKAGRDEEQKRREQEQKTDAASVAKATTDLQDATTNRPPPVAMPSAEIGPPLDPEATKNLSWGLFTMGLVGVLGAKKHWNEASAAMDGMLKGFKDGAEDNIRENKAKFDREYRLAKDKEAAQTKVYDDLVASKKLSLNAVFDTMKIHAAANNDWTMWNAANAKDYDQMVTLAGQRHVAADNMQKQATTLQDRIDARNQKREDKAKADAGGATGISDRYKNDPAYKKQVDEWAGRVNAGLQLPQRFAQIVGKQFSKDVYLQAGTSANTGQAVANKLDLREMTAEAQKLGTQSASVAIANKELERFIPPALAAMDNVPRAAWRPINQVLQMGENTWSPEQGKLVLANRAVLNAFSQLIQRGAPTVHSLTEAENLLNTADSKDVYRAKLEQLTQEGVQAELGLKDAHDDLMKRAKEMGNGPAALAAGAAPYSDPDKEARYQKWKAEHGGG